MKSIYTTLLLLLIKTAAFSQTTYYVNDGSNTGDVFTSATGSNSNAGTPAAPFATLQYAVSAAAAGDIIYVDAGSYSGQVTIDKGITIIGAGQTLTYITNSSPLVAPPGPFTEYALIQTTQGIGDVYIRDITATNGTAKVILQGRKYGLGSFVIAQRTANISKSILNQCNTIFAMRVFDDTGKQFLENYIGSDYSNLLPTLEERHCVAIGKALKLKQPVILELNDMNEIILPPVENVAEPLITA